MKKIKKILGWIIKDQTLQVELEDGVYMPIQSEVITDKYKLTIPKDLKIKEIHPYRPPLDYDRQLDARIAKMQSDKSKEGVKALFKAKPEELGKVAVEQPRKRGRPKTIKT